MDMPQASVQLTGPIPSPFFSFFSGIVLKYVKHLARELGVWRFLDSSVYNSGSQPEKIFPSVVTTEYVCVEGGCVDTRI